MTGRQPPDAIRKGKTGTGTNFRYYTSSVEYPNGERTAYNVSRAYQVNGVNQYTGTTSGGVPSATFDYDFNGNLVSDGSTGFVYDAENRLVSASGAKNATLAYDPLGRLWQVSSGAATSRFVYDGAGNRLRIYVHGQGADEPLVWYEWTGGPVHRFYHSDQQGSIVALSDDYGNALAINAYDAWGIPNAGNAGRFQYTGQAWIPELGMYYYKARIYSPTLGRFLQTDPIGYQDQINLYAYVGNDPINLTDPDGQQIVNPFRGLNYLLDKTSPETRDKIADAVEVVGVLWDIVTLPTGAGSGPEGIVATKAAAIGIRQGAGEAAENRTRNAAKGIPESRLGPSGKPVVHTVHHSTTKGAREAAQREVPPGGKVRFDAHPKDGQRPHYQAEDARGRNVKPVVHHCPPATRCRS